MQPGWTKVISVDKDIVQLLSRRTYDSFPQALREVVSNAYDADATLVEITIDPKADQIGITDNGCGMTTEDFDYYLRIAARSRRARGTSRFGRQRIGQFGIGFLSVFPFCCTMRITSTVENSDATFTAFIDAEKYVRPSDSIVDVGSIEVRGADRRDPSIRRKHGTSITLVGLTGLVKQYLEIRADANRRSVESWDWSRRLRWQLGQILPLEYAPGSVLAPILATDPVTPMEVRLNSTKLYRNEIEGAEVLEFCAEPVTLTSGVRFTHAIVTPRGAISPREARGLQLRFRNVGIGEPTYFGLNIVGRLYPKLQWLGGEVHVIEGLDDELSMDRSNFTWSPRYEDLSRYFLERVGRLAGTVETEHYAVRDIQDFVRGDMRRAPGIPKREAIERCLQVLHTRGYSIIVLDDIPEESVLAFNIDVEKQRITFFPNHPDVRDRIEVAGCQYELMFAEWDYQQSESPACLVKRGKIIFNRNYPPFADRRTDGIVRKVAVLLEVGRTRFSTAGDLCRFVLERLPDELGGP